MSLFRELLDDFVEGTPRPKGSLDTHATRDGAGRLTGGVHVKDSPQSVKWRRTMAQRLRSTYAARSAEPVVGPVVVRATFWFDPKRFGSAAQGTPWPMHPQIGDLDKLLRNLLDALAVDETGKGNGAAVIANDRQVVRFDAGTEKRWSLDGREGVHVIVWEIV